MFLGIKNLGLDKSDKGKGLSGARENRTPNLLIANQTLCQLSYSPGAKIR